MSKREVQTGFAAVVRETDFDLNAAVGGKQGIAEGVLPTLVFLIVYTITHEIIWAALLSGIALVPFLVIRLLNKQSLTQIFAGIIGVGIGAIWAVKSGNDTGFFLPGLLINGLYGVVLLVSVALGKPIVGYIAAMLDPRVLDWKKNALSRRLYLHATLTMASLFVIRLAIYLPLYYAGAVQAMGIVRLFTGIPAFAFTLWWAWRLHLAAVKELSPQQEKLAS